MITIVDKNGKPTGEILLEPDEYHAALSLCNQDMKSIKTKESEK